MRRFFIAAAAVCLCAATASAQTKISGTAQFGKPDPSHMVPVGDRPNHNMGVGTTEMHVDKADGDRRR